MKQVKKVRDLFNCVHPSVKLLEGKVASYVNIVPWIKPKKSRICWFFLLLWFIYSFLMIFILLLIILLIIILFVFVFIQKKFYEVLYVMCRHIHNIFWRISMTLVMDVLTYVFADRLHFITLSNFHSTQNELKRTQPKSPFNYLKFSCTTSLQV